MSHPFLLLGSFLASNSSFHSLFSLMTCSFSKAHSPLAPSSLAKNYSLKSSRNLTRSSFLDSPGAWHLFSWNLVHLSRFKEKDETELTPAAALCQALFTADSVSLLMFAEFESPCVQNVYSPAAQMHHTQLKDGVLPAQAERLTRQQIPEPQCGTPWEGALRCSIVKGACMLVVIG